MLIVCGPPCAGKSTFGRIASSLGLVYREGSIAVMELFQENRVSNEDVIDFCRRWHNQCGRDIFARENARRILRLGLDMNQTVFVGCRTIEEIRYWRSLVSNTRVIAVYADAMIRFQRCVVGGRINEPFTEFVRRDMREFEMGLAAILAYGTDYFLVNQGSMAEFEELAMREVREHYRRESL